MRAGWLSPGAMVVACSKEVGAVGGRFNACVCWPWHQGGWGLLGEVTLVLLRAPHQGLRATRRPPLPSCRLSSAALAGKGAGCRVGEGEPALGERRLDAPADTIDRWVLSRLDVARYQWAVLLTLLLAGVTAITTAVT